MVREVSVVVGRDRELRSPTRTEQPGRPISRPQPRGNVPSIYRWRAGDSREHGRPPGTSHCAAISAIWLRRQPLGIIPSAAPDALDRTVRYCLICRFPIGQRPHPTPEPPNVSASAGQPRPGRQSAAAATQGGGENGVQGTQHTDKRHWQRDSPPIPTAPNLACPRKRRFKPIYLLSPPPATRVISSCG
jgi:hypothetical protein